MNLFLRLSNKCSIKLILVLIKKAALMSEYNGKIHEENVLSYRICTSASRVLIEFGICGYTKYVVVPNPDTTMHDVWDEKNRFLFSDIGS